MAGDGSGVTKVFGGLKEFLKKDEVVKDCFLFRFHSVYTAVLLFACSLLVTASQYVGDPIQCIADSSFDKERMKPMNTYCWISSSTYTFRHSIYQEIHPGVGAVSKTDNLEEQHYPYYLWVCFALFFQGIVCYFPKWLWDDFEGGLMTALISGLNHFVYTPKEKDAKKKVIVRYMLDHTEMHRTYVLRYWLYELLCLANIFAQLYFMNFFFEGELLKYRLNILEILAQHQNVKINSVIKLFPRMTTCKFRRVDYGGDVKEHDLLCLLPQNEINEEIYIFLWFWFILLAVSFVFLMLHRLRFIVFPSSRWQLLNSTRKVVSKQDIRIVSSNMDYGGSWFLYMVGQNLNRVVFNEVIIDLATKMENLNEKNYLRHVSATKNPRN